MAKVNKKNMSLRTNKLRRGGGLTGPVRRNDGDLVMRCRLALALNSGELGILTGVDKGIIRDVERGNHYPGWELLLNLARLMQKEIDLLAAELSAAGFELDELADRDFLSGVTNSGQLPERKLKQILDTQFEELCRLRGAKAETEVLE